MAYINQEQKKEIAKQIKPLLKEYGLKGSLSIDNYSTIILTISSGVIDFISDYNNTGKESYRGFGEFQPVTDNMEINPYHYDKHFSDKNTLEFIKKAIMALKGEGWYNNSDLMTDYFDIKHYVDIKIGKWNKPYQLVK